MQVRDLVTQLSQWAIDDPDVVVRIKIAEKEDNGEFDYVLDEVDDVDGSYADINDERSILFENGRVVIIADVNE